MASRLFPQRGAPVAIAAKTHMARRALPARRLLRAHTAASASALLADWFGTSSSGNGVTAREARSLRRRARELRENSSIVARYSHLCRDNILGTNGVTLAAFVPRPRGKNEEASRRLEERWYRWVTKATVDGRSLLVALQQLVESWKVEGEGLATMVLRGSELALEVIDADRLDQDYTETLRTGHHIEQGIESDATGRIVAYHIFDAAEDDQRRKTRRRWSADDVLYIGHRVRPGQRRGLTPLAPVMVLIQHLEKTDEALVVLNRTAASKMFQLVAQEWATPLLGPDGEVVQASTDDVGNDEVSPGATWVPPHGYKAETIDPGQPTQEYDALQTNLLRKVATGLNVAATSLTGNLSDANYGSQRGGLLAERDAWMVDQQLLIDEVLVRLFDRWLRVEVLAQRVQLPLGVTIAEVVERSEWYPRRWSWIDPEKDAKGLGELIKLRLTSHRRELNKMGIDVRTLFEEIRDDEALAKEFGLTLLVGTATAAAKPSGDTSEDDDDEKPKTTPRSIRTAA